MSAKKTIVCFAGGTSGDLVVAMIDSLDCGYEINDHRIKLTKDRSGMKKPWMFKNADEKRNYITDTFEIYDSLPSHDIDFHIGEKSENVIGITCFDKVLRDKSASRFKNLHTSEVWDYLTKATNTKTLDQYSNDILEVSKKLKNNFLTIDLSQIVGGNLPDLLHQMGFDITVKSGSLYEYWLTNPLHQTFPPSIS
jgi:hypothetical protein